MSFSRSTINQRSVLGDASGLSNTRSSSRSSRRKSFSVSDRSGHGAETPSKADRRALLAEWRNSRGTGSATSSTHSHASGIPTSAEIDSKKRARMHDAPSHPPLPPSASSTSVGQEARDRIRQRKQQRLHQHEESPREPAVKSSIEYYDDEDDAGSGRRLTTRSPLLRSSLGGARRRSFSTSGARRGRGASPLLSQESEGESQHATDYCFPFFVC